MTTTTAAAAAAVCMANIFPSSSSWLARVTQLIVQNRPEKKEMNRPKPSKALIAVELKTKAGFYLPVIRAGPSN